MFRFSRGLVASGLALASCAGSGCDTTAAGGLLVATTLPAGERRRIESDFREWQQAPHNRAGASPAVHLSWLVLGERDDPAKLADRRSPPDVFLSAGGSEPVGTWGVRDPRSHPAALAWVVDQIGRGRWREVYARLVRLAAARAAAGPAPPEERAAVLATTRQAGVGAAIFAVPERSRCYWGRRGRSGRPSTRRSNR